MGRVPNSNHYYPLRKQDLSQSTNEKPRNSFSAHLRLLAESDSQVKFYTLPKALKTRRIENRKYLDIGVIPFLFYLICKYISPFQSVKFKKFNLLRGNISYANNKLGIRHSQNTIKFGRNINRHGHNSFIVNLLRQYVH